MYDLIVVGGGAAGLNVASAAAAVGARVALVEKHKLGGECTHTACVPSKALLEAARIAYQASRAAAFGIRLGPAQVDFAAVMERIGKLVDRFAATESAEVLRSKGIDVYFGTAAFEAYDTILIDGKLRLNAHRFVIATGARPFIPPVPGLAEAGYLENESVWALRALPESLLVLGAGPAGIEFAQAFSRLGAKVTVLTEGSQILPREDPEIAGRLQSLLSAEGITFYTSVEITAVELRDGKKVARFRSKADGATFEAARDAILVCTGRAPNVEGLNLEAAGVPFDARQGIEVDEHLRTRAPHILAVGDVTGRYQFTHAAEREAAVAFQNAILRIPRKMEYDTIPWATFTDPELATVGRLDVEPGSDARIYHLDLAEVDRAQIDGEPAALARLVASPSGKILGASILGAEASLVLQQFVVAMENGLTLNDLLNTVQIYPTNGAIVRRLALKFSASRLEKSYVQTALRWFYGFSPRSAPKLSTTVQADGHGHP